MSNPKYPFSAILGQHQFKLALILSAINPSIGGVLVSGPRGSAKSTLARGLADILDGHQQFITLPLAATEDMLVGTLDLQKVLSDQKVSFNPGILLKANNGVLYVDEVNLLADPLVDLLLDVSASGINYVERDGISHQHDSRFILLGTMNPDEGELRAQLLDRFGLSVNLDTEITIDERMEIVRLREDFDRDPETFVDSFQEQQLQLKQNIVKAKAQLLLTTCPVQYRREIAIRCQQARVDGIRADIVWLKAALAHAALSGRTEVSQEDISTVEELVLAHRRQEQGNSSNGHRSSESPPFSRPDDSQQEPKQSEDTGEWGQMEPQKQKIADVSLQLPDNFINFSKNDTSNLSPSPSKNDKSSIVGGTKVSTKLSSSVNWFSTLISSLGQWPPQKFIFKNVKVGQPVINCILLDTSASILKGMQFSRAKTVVLQLAENAYKNREQLVVFGFGNQQVQELMVKQKAPKAIKKWLEDISAAGGTPLREMLNHISDYQHKLAKNNPTLHCRNFLITDGRSSQKVEDVILLGETTLIDIEDAQIKRGRGVELATQLNGRYYSLLA